MARARIYRPSKNAMQSGKARTRRWVLSFEPQKGRFVDSLMGWSGSSDMDQQVHLSFDTLEQAEAYACERNLDYEIIEATKRRSHVKAYTQNFAYGRKEPWTH